MSKALLLALPVLAGCLTSCDTIKVLQENKRAVECSTYAICENIRAIEEANAAIEENRTQLQAINESLKSAGSSH